MTSERGRMAALKTLIDQAAGGYDLLEPVLDAYQLNRNLAAVQAEPAPTYFHDEAAADVLEAVSRGETPDLAAVGARVRRAIEASVDRDHADRVMATASERAQYRALGVVQKHADDVVVSCLRPAFQSVLEQARRDAGALAGHPVDAASLIVAPTPVRKAWAALRDAGQRYRLLREAWQLTNTAGLRSPEHDTRNQFASLQHPHELFPELPAGAALPQLPFPTDVVQLAVWLVTGDGAKAKPWLPTIAEQDQAWLAVYGQATERRRVAHDHVIATVGR